MCFEKRRKGVTLIELIVVIAILGLVTSAAFSLQFFGLSSFRQTSDQVDLQSVVRQASNVILSEMRKARAVDLSVENQITFTLPDDSTGTFALVDGHLVKDGSQTYTSLPVLSDLNFVLDESGDLPLLTVTVQATDDGGETFDLTRSTVLRNQGAEEESMAETIISENIFLYGSSMTFGGGSMVGEGASLFVTGDLSGSDFNGGANIGVSNFYIDGSFTDAGYGITMGSSSDPGEIHITGSLTASGGSNFYGNILIGENLSLSGSPTFHNTLYVYGDLVSTGNPVFEDSLYINGDLELASSEINNDIYVKGNLVLGWEPTFDGGSRIYYAGTLTTPSNYKNSILNRLNQIPIEDFPEPFLQPQMPDLTMPTFHEDQWYVDRGYTSTGTMDDDLRIFSDGYLSSNSGSVENVIVLAREGDIEISVGGGSTFEGILIAPKGSVTFSGAAFTGLVIARDGFFYSNGGTTATFKNMNELILDPNNYPIQ